MGEPIPRLRGLDSTAALLREGYAFGGRRFAQCGSDAFRTRITARPALVMRGREAAQLLYRPGRTTRRRALPLTTLTLLQDLHSVEMLDGDDHLRRKEMFLSVMTPESLDTLGDVVEAEWRDRLPEWGRSGEVVLLDAVREVLGRAVCAWSGLSVSDPDAAVRTHQFAAMVEGAGAVGPRNWRGQVLRHRAERWAGAVIRDVRSGALDIDPARPAAVVAGHRGPDGALLPEGTARVELLNLLRPTVAVARFITFAALALHLYPECRDGAAADPMYRRWFVQEVRRFYPFFPMIGARALSELEFRGTPIAPGSWLLLDIFATDHDPRTWSAPQSFRPDRFRDWDGDPFGLVPQGGGEHRSGHRCAGEWLTIGLLERAVGLLTTTTYEVPLQDLSIDLSRMPARPKTGLLVRGVRAG